MLAATLRPTCLAGLLVTGVSAGEIRVPEDYATIQEALVAASSGDRISVAAGVYVESLDFLGKDVMVEGRSWRAPNDTYLVAHMDVSAVRFVGGEGRGAGIRGFTIAEGGGEALDPSSPLHRHGGGILVLNGSSPTIEDNHIRENGLWDAGIHAGHFGEGAGIYVGPSCSPEIRNNLIEENFYGGPTSKGLGGGISVVQATPWIHDNIVRDNWATRGGGLYLDASPALVERNQICANDAIWGSQGGGIYCLHDPAPTIRDNLISWNRAHFLQDPSSALGGGVYASCNDLVLERNRIVHNRSDLFGGGMSLSGAGLILRDCLVAHNTVGQSYSDGKGGGLHVEAGSVSVESCTFADNQSSGSGAAIACGAGLVSIQGCIVWRHATSALDGVPVLVEYTDIQGGWIGSGNLDQDPLFEDAPAEDYRLRPASPCIEAGPPGRMEPGADLAGTPRVLDGDLDRSMVVDMGALEFSNVRLEVRKEGLPADQWEFLTRGTRGLRVFLFASLEPGQLLLAPYGSALVDVQTATWSVFSFGVIPSTKVLTVPYSLPTPLTVHVQELAVLPTGKGGNFSHRVQLDLK